MKADMNALYGCKYISLMRTNVLVLYHFHPSVFIKPQVHLGDQAPTQENCFQTDHHHLITKDI